MRENLGSRAKGRVWGSVNGNGHSSNGHWRNGNGGARASKKGPRIDAQDFWGPAVRVAPSGVPRLRSWGTRVPKLVSLRDARCGARSDDRRTDGPERRERVRCEVVLKYGCVGEKEKLAVPSEQRPAPRGRERGLLT